MHDKVFSFYAPINVKPAGGEAGHRAGFWSIALARARSLGVCKLKEMSNSGVV